MTTEDDIRGAGPFTEAKAAPLLGMSPRQLRAVRAAGKIGYFDISAGSGQRQHVRYTREHLTEFIEARSRRASSTVPAAAPAAPRTPRQRRVTTTAKPRDQVAETVARSIARGDVAEWKR